MAIRFPAIPRTGFYAAAIFVGALSLLPGGALQPTQIGDKVEHFLTYALLGLLGVTTARSRNRAAYSILGLVAFGAAIEILQMFSPGRYAEIGDALANAAGALIGGAIAIAWRRRRAAASTR
jgi:VanZ family protein